MDVAAPTFITSREMDVFLGGGERGPRKRQRLQREHLLPDPARIGRVNRINIAMFPRFALAGLVGDLTRLDGAPECLGALTRQAFGLAMFSQLADAVRLSARGMDVWRFDQLIVDLTERAQPAVTEWNASVSAAEQELQRRFGITFSAAFGMVERASSGLCIVSLASGGSETFDADRVAAPVEKGRAVAIERVRVMDSEMSFVMPSTIDVPDRDERELCNWLAGMMTTPAEATTSAVDDSTAEPLSYARRSAPRRARWRGASTMTRACTEQLAETLEAQWNAYAARRGPVAYEHNSLKLAYLLAGGQPAEEADEQVTDTIAAVLDGAWALEGAGLEEVSASEEAVRFDGADAGEHAAQRLDDLIGRLRELAELATRSAEALESRR